MWVVLGTVAIVIAMVGLGLVLDRWIGVLPRPEELTAGQRPAPSLPAAGETAGCAIRATSAARSRVIARQRCCQVTMAAGAEEPVVLAGKRLVVVRLTCAVCGAHRPLYFEPTA
ncbi:MAG TPA: hypothetical protein VHE35_13365 [Kofleriaceae bacterium]|nr:hypothetical protein [Kofleriaceae bacterium]